jgi:hypothetical protein
MIGSHTSNDSTARGAVAPGVESNGLAMSVGTGEKEERWLESGE